MYEHHRTATIQFLEYRIESSVAQIDPACVGHQNYPIDAKGVKGELDLPQRTLHVR